MAVNPSLLIVRRVVRNAWLQLFERNERAGPFLRQLSVEVIVGIPRGGGAKVLPLDRSQVDNLASSTNRPRAVKVYFLYPSRAQKGVASGSVWHVSTCRAPQCMRRVSHEARAR